MTVEVPARRPGLRQRVLTQVARRLGVTVADVAPGAALISRSGGYDVRPVVGGEAHLVSRRRSGVRRSRLGPGITLLTSGRARSKLRRQPLGEQTWLIDAPRAPEAAVSAAEIGTRGWLIARPDPSPTAALTLETQTLQHLGAQHVAWLLERYQIDCVLDVGANNGQFAQRLRHSGYTGHIISFEPVPRFVDAMRTLAADDDKWTVHQLALGSTEGSLPLRVQRSFSSLLTSTDYGKQRFATLREFADTDQIEVPIRRLDSMIDELLAPLVQGGTADPRVFLKMDTQGFDLEVFRGLGDRTEHIVALQSEIALLMIYQQMPRMPEALAVYEAAGYELTGLYPVTREPDGRVIEYDCTMVRAAALPPR